MINPDASVSYTTFSQWCAKVRKIAVPEGIAEGLKPAFDNYVLNALIKAQRYIDCLRKSQVAFYDHSQQQVHCGVSQISPPRGPINVVYAFKPGEQCVKHYYTPVSPHRIATWSQQSENLCSFDNIPPGVGTTIWSDGGDICYAYCELYGTTEDDTCWKCAPKICARGQNGELWLAPRPPCGYIIAVHWEGLKRTWLASDAIVDDADLIGWAAQYVASEMAVKADADQRMAALNSQGAADKFADMMWWCDEEKHVQSNLDAVQGLDTGNLCQMFQPIYPYPYQEVTVCSPFPYSGGGGGTDPEEPEPEPFPEFAFYDTFEDYEDGSEPAGEGTGWDGDWDFDATDYLTVIAYDGFDYTAGQSLSGQTGGFGFSGPWV